MTKVKICGITNAEDGRLAAELGTDSIGLNFVLTSPRLVTVDTAREIAKALPGEVQLVGVFVDESVERIRDIADSIRLDAVQLHGNEPPEFANELMHQSGLTVIKAFRISDRLDLDTVRRYNVDAILLDSFSVTANGGTGERFDWKIARELTTAHPNVYLAGGIGPANVGEAISFVRPYAVDVCSGVESETGKKDPEKMAQFFRAVDRAKYEVRT